MIRKEKTTEVKEEYTSELRIVLLFVIISNIAYFLLLLIVMHSSAYNMFGENWIFWLLPVHFIVFFAAYIIHSKRHRDEGEASFLQYVLILAVFSVLMTITVLFVLRVLRVIV